MSNLTQDIRHVIFDTRNKTYDLGRKTQYMGFIVPFVLSKVKIRSNKNQKVQKKREKRIESAYKGNKKCLKGGATFGKC